MTTLVVLTSGERLEVRGEDDHGVRTDAGLHAWADVLGFRVWHAKRQTWVSIPV